MLDDRPQVTVGVVGTGGIAKAHLDYLATSPRTRLLGVADLSRASARYAADRWSADAWFTSHQEMLALARPQVVHVLTPPHTHARIVGDALDAGCHVVCEKPLATTGPELEGLLRQAEDRGLWLLEDQNYRWNDPVLALEDSVRQGRLGRVRDVEVRMALPLRDGGVFADQHLRSPAHDLPAGPVHDLLPHLSYLGLLFVPGAARPDRVSAHWSNHGGDDGLWRCDDLDATVIADGVHLRLRFSAVTRPEALTVTVRGELGEASADVFHPFFTARSPRSVGKQLSPIVDHVANGLGLARSGVRNLTQKLLQHSAMHGLERFLDGTYSALQHGGAPPLSADDLRATAHLTDLLLLPEHQR